MDVLRFGLFLITIIANCAVNAKFSQIPFENITAGHELRKHLLTNYDKVVIPATSKKPIHIKMTIVFNNIELNYDTSQMIIYAWMNAEWNDNRLTWDPSAYDQLNFTLFEHREIWHPDFMAYNNINAITMHEHTQSLVNNTGNVLWVQPVQYRIHCRTDMTRWPYDTQTGLLKIGSWVYSNNVINLTETAHEIEIINPYSEWKILRISSEKFTKLYPCCPDDPYDHVEYNITVDRENDRYRPIIYLPAMSTATLNLLVFWLSPDDACKLITSLFDALIVVVILLVMYSKIPLTLSSIPLIVQYYAYSLGLIALTAVISVVIKNLIKSGKPLTEPMSKFVQSTFVKFFGIEINPSSTNNEIQTQYEDNQINILNYLETNKKQTLSKIIDKISFIVFSIIYVILLFHFVF